MHQWRLGVGSVRRVPVNRVAPFNIGISPAAWRSENASGGTNPYVRRDFVLEICT